MKMIDWDVLIRADNDAENTEITPESRASPTALGDDFEKVGRLESSNDNGFKDSALLAHLTY